MMAWRHKQPKAKRDDEEDDDENDDDDDIQDHPPPASLCFALLRFASICFDLLRFASICFDNEEVDEGRVQVEGEAGEDEG